jgi:hypothetical protein
VKAVPIALTDSRSSSARRGLTRRALLALTMALTIAPSLLPGAPAIAADQAPNLATSVQISPIRVAAGNQAWAEIGVANSSNVAAKGVTLTVSLSGGTTPAGLDAGSWACSTASGSISCRLDRLEGLARAARIRFRLTAGEPGALTVRAAVTEDNGPDAKSDDDIAEATATVTAAATRVLLSQSVDTVPVGEDQSLTAVAEDASGKPLPDITTVTFGIGGPAAPPAGGPFTALAALPSGRGYWLASAAGAVVPAGLAADYGDAQALSAPVVDIDATPSGKGYWLTAADGAVIARGDAPSLGSLAGSDVRHSVVALVPSSSRRGYLLVTSDGDVHAFGDAHDRGSTPPGSPPVIAAAGTPGRDGYWLLGAGGALYAFGDARHYGDVRGVRTSWTIVGFAPTPSGNGYWFVAADGGIYSFGDAAYLGSPNSMITNTPTATITSTAGGYWVLGHDGLVFAFGAAGFYGPATAASTAGGKATVAYRAATAGTTKAVASVAKPGGAVQSAPLSSTWTAAASPTLDASPRQTSADQGADQLISAVVLDRSGSPVPDGTPVGFTAAGTGGETPAVGGSTTTGGVATFSFRSTATGQSKVTVTGAGQTATSTVTWRDPVPVGNPPEAPRNVVVRPPANGGAGWLDLSWDPPVSDGGSPVTAYSVTELPSEQTSYGFGPTPTRSTIGSTGRGELASYTVTARNAIGVSLPSAPSNDVAPPWPSSGSNNGAGDPAGRSAPSGYWMLGAGGSVYAFGGAGYHGAPVMPAGLDAVDLEQTPSAGGYWILDSAGTVHAFGDAVPHGNVGWKALASGEAVSSLSATPTAGGYWIFTSRGRVLPFGDARFFGDMSATKLNGPVLDSIPTPSGAGYYMVASDGGIFAFGDARFAGSMGGRPLNKPVQSLVPDSDGSGYWLVASDGGLFAFDAPFRGSMGGRPLNKPVTGMVRYGNGYLMVATDGGIFAFSDKPFAGSLGANPPAQPIVSVAATG